MIRRILAAFVMLGLMLAGQATTAHAQDILGLSLRPTDAMPGSPGRGSVDITRSNGEGNYTIKVDMSGSADGMDLAEFEGATDWVVWAVDMDGVRHNIGTLDGDLMLESAAVSYMVARVYVTAESDASVKQPSEPLFSVTLRQVEEVDTVPADEEEASDEMADDEAADEDAADAASDEEETPAELPTTGGPLSDMLLLLAVAATLLFGGLRLRAVRIA
jgi:hypothetical protein